MNINDFQMYEDVKMYVNKDTYLLEKIITKRQNNTIAELELGAIEREIIINYLEFNQPNSIYKAQFNTDFYSDFLMVKNTGDSTLVFNQIIPNCDCTSLSNANIEIPAGKTDTLKFVLETYGKDSGTFESEIRLVTNTIPDWHKLKITEEIE